MRLNHLRRIASGVLVLAALVLGGVVGNVVLLRSADTTNTTVGQLSARLDAPVATPAPTSATTTPTATPGHAQVPRGGPSGERADGGGPDD